MAGYDILDSDDNSQICARCRLSRILACNDHANYIATRHVFALQSKDEEPLTQTHDYHELDTPKLLQVPCPGCSLC